MQITVLFISLAGILLVSAAFVFAIARSGERADDYATVTRPRLLDTPLVDGRFVSAGRIPHRRHAQPVSAARFGRR